MAGGTAGGGDGGLVGRIERAAGVPDLVDVLAGRLKAPDLDSLLLAVHARRAARLAPADVLRRYESSAFVAPARIDPLELARVRVAAFEVLVAGGYQGIELSPVSPLGTVSALGPVDQNNVLAAGRGTEVVADATNSLALECAVRRRALLRADPRDRGRVRLFAAHRQVRAQRFDRPDLRQHFQLLALVTAGRDEGSFRFQTAALVEQIDLLLRVLAEARRLGSRTAGVRVRLTDLTGVRRTALDEQVAATLRRRHPGINVDFDQERAKGRGYYVDACFSVEATAPSGARMQVCDGGLTTWTARLLGNAKERLLIGSLGVERLLEQFR